MYVCMYVCMYVMYVSMYVCMYVHVYICVCMCVCVCSLPSSQTTDSGVVGIHSRSHLASKWERKLTYM